MWLSAPANQRVTLARAGAGISRPSESYVGSKVCCARAETQIVLTNSQDLWSKCPVVVVASPCVLMSKSPLRTQQLDCWVLVKFDR